MLSLLTWKEITLYSPPIASSSPVGIPLPLLQKTFTCIQNKDNVWKVWLVDTSLERSACPFYQPQQHFRFKGSKFSQICISESWAYSTYRPREKQIWLTEDENNNIKKGGEDLGIELLDDKLPWLRACHGAPEERFSKLAPLRSKNCCLCQSYWELLAAAEFCTISVENRAQVATCFWVWEEMHICCYRNHIPGSPRTGLGNIRELENRSLYSKGWPD